MFNFWSLSWKLDYCGASKIGLDLYQRTLKRVWLSTLSFCWSVIYSVPNRNGGAKYLAR